MSTNGPAMTLLKLYAKKNSDSQMTGATNSHYRKTCNHQDWQATKRSIPRTEGCFSRRQHTNAMISHSAINGKEMLPLATTCMNLASIILVKDFFRASLRAQLVKNPPALQDTLV